MLLEIDMPRLVLTRKIDESVVLHDDAGVIATVKVSKIDKSQVRLTFEAEPSLKIDRQEIFTNKEKISSSG